jgi:hypothetical protein
MSACTAGSCRMTKGGRVIKIVPCNGVEKDHAEDIRAYAHVFHLKDIKVCVAAAFWALPENIRLAILLHEMGHLLAGPRGSEVAANKAVKQASGISCPYISLVGAR